MPKRAYMVKFAYKEVCILKKKKDSPEPRTAAGKDRHKERRERRSHDAGGRDSLRSARQGQRPETAVWRTEM